MRRGRGEGRERDGWMARDHVTCYEIPRYRNFVLEYRRSEPGSRDTPPKVDSFSQRSSDWRLDWGSYKQ